MSKAQRCCCLCGNSTLSTQITLANLPLSHHLRRTPEEPDPRFEVEFAAFGHELAAHEIAFFRFA